MNLQCLIVVGFATTLQAQWLTCPTAFGNGSQVGPCDGGKLDEEEPFVNHVKAGDRLKVSWPSMNVGGGLVRLSLVPEGLSEFHAAFDQSVIKLACFGHDQRYQKFNETTGRCNHPCNGRPGGHWQADSQDLERYDTSIGIPINLPEGMYVLQWKALVSDEKLPRYSCARLYVTSPTQFTNQIGQSCVPPVMKELPCKVIDGGPKLNALMKDSQFGDFCFLSIPGSGTSISSNQVDETIGWLEPINKGCDGRATCDLAIDQVQCRRELVREEDLGMKGGEVHNVDQIEKVLFGTSKKSRYGLEKGKPIADLSLGTDIDQYLEQLENQHQNRIDQMSRFPAGAGAADAFIPDITYDGEFYQSRRRLGRGPFADPFRDDERRPREQYPWRPSSRDSYDDYRDEYSIDEDGYIQEYVYEDRYGRRHHRVRRVRGRPRHRRQRRYGRNRYRNDSESLRRGRRAPTTTNRRGRRRRATTNRVQIADEVENQTITPSASILQTSTAMERVVYRTVTSMITSTFTASQSPNLPQEYDSIVIVTTPIEQPQVPELPVIGEDEMVDFNNWSMGGEVDDAPLDASLDDNEDGDPVPTNIVLGATCRYPTDKYFCSGVKLARCVHFNWHLYDCAPGTECRDGNCRSNYL